jgi:hypothetical protein
VEIKPPLWKWMKHSIRYSYDSIQLRDEANHMSHDEHRNTSYEDMYIHHPIVGARVKESHKSKNDDDVLY